MEYCTDYTKLLLRPTDSDAKLYLHNISKFWASPQTRYKKRDLSYKTPQSVHRPRYCGVQTWLLKVHYRVKNWGEIGEASSWSLIPNELDLTFWVTKYGAKFRQN